MVFYTNSYRLMLVPPFGLYLGWGAAVKPGYVGA
jgi:hypothetical protein